MNRFAPRNTKLRAVRCHDRQMTVCVDEPVAALHRPDSRCMVHLVGGDCTRTEELKARMAGGAMYVCKPVEAAWLSIAELPLRSLGRCA